MKLKRILAGVAVTVMVCAAAMSSAGAYFTTYDPAEGGQAYTYSSNIETRIKEQADVGWKKLKVLNTGEIEVQVRARFVYPSEYADLVTPDVEASTGWTAKDDGWYYYTGTVKPGEESSLLTATIELPSSMDHTLSDELNIVAVYEAIPADAAWDSQGVS